MLRDYQPGNYFDETFVSLDQPRAHYQDIVHAFETYGRDEFQRRWGIIDLMMRQQGITFTVYSDTRGTERTFPFDPFPRVIPATEWQALEKGLKQRVKAINTFLHDIYHEQNILNEGVVPRELIEKNPNFRPEMQGIDVPHKTYTHVVGTDLIRDKQGKYMVLEDNLRSPSGVSYMLGNRTFMLRSFPQLMASQHVRTIRDYPNALLATLRSLSFSDVEPTIVVLTPGQYNSAYYEHAFLAQQMGVELAHGHDLFCHDGRVWMRTTQGRRAVDVIYRRIDDAFLDPLTFRKDSMLGVPGLMDVYKAGRIALANAVGTGVADDKAMYMYIPKIIEYYLGEKALLENVPTYMAADPEQWDYIVDHVHNMVIKEVGGAGGYGMLVGSEANDEDIATYLDKVRADPSNYIAQPIVQLSRHPTYYQDSKRFEPCHVDLRPYILMGEDITVIPGGLTRVALKRGSLVVNSSQGGGSKDTWVLANGY
ncbi:MAG: circularly permuted type 2 ATP-grasp protein [Deinococcota bacterium]